MAGKRMKLSMSMPVFSLNPVYKPTLDNWEEAISDIEYLKESLVSELRKITANIVNVNWLDPRFMQSLVELTYTMDNESGLILKTSHDAIRINSTGYSDFMSATINDVAQESIESGLWFMMVLNTYRAMIMKQVGPMPGLNFNITIAGIVATCLRLNVAVDFEGE
jgi:hypothetical protein